MPEVGVVQFGIMPVLRHELVVAALLDDFAAPQHDDAVCRAHSAETMRDENRRGLREDQVKRFLNLRFGERVDARRRFVENEDGGALHQHTQQADQLALPHAQARATFAYVALQTVWQRFQPFAAADAVGNFDDFGVGRFGAGVANVFHDRAAEQERLLRDNAEPTAVFLQIEGANVAPIDANFALLEFVETRQRLSNRAFARAGMTDERDAFARFDRQVEIVQHALPSCTGTRGGRTRLRRAWAWGVLHRLFA